MVTSKKRATPVRSTRTCGAHLDNGQVGGKNARSKFEATIGRFLETDAPKAGATWDYEVSKFHYQKPVPRKSTYSPVFRITTVSGRTIYVEAKGRFESLDDRLKLLLVIEQNPGIDIRMLFQNPNLTISKASRTTYTQWAEQNGITWAAGTRIPKAWLEE